MYEITENVILSGTYELTDMLSKIDILWLQGHLTDVQREALMTLARDYADPSRSFGPIQFQLDSMAARISDLAARISALEGSTGEEWPQFVQPTGAHDAYYRGDKVVYEGRRYICKVPEGLAVVWSPEVYPSYWEEA